MHRRVLILFSANRGTMLRALLALAAAVAFSTPAAAQTWTGAAADGGNWNNPANWTNPSQVPNSAIADVVFAPSAVSGVSIPAVFQVRSLTFASATNSYTLAIPLQVGNKWLTGLQTITVANNVTTTQQISLGGDATGSLLFTGDGPAALTIANNALPTGVAAPTLLIGPFTSIGTTGSGGVTVTGTGTTTISGSFATSGSSAVVGGLTKTGPGILTLSGNGATLNGGVNLAGGTLRLDYSTNQSSKLGGGVLTSSGGDLVLVPPAVAAVTQNVVSTALTAGHTQVNAQAGGNVTIGLGAITRSAPATLDLSPGGANLSVATSNTTTNGLLGNGPAFATVGGRFWASASLGQLTGIVGTPNGFGAGLNADVENSNSFGTSFTTNSLRFIADGLTLNLSGTNTIQSGGILLPSNVSTATITGGALDAVIAHVYGDDLTIGSDIIASNGITKTGPGTLTLAGDNFDLNGPVNVNRGHLRATNPLAIVFLDAINFNDARTGPGLQRFTVEVGDNTNGGTGAAIRLSAYSAGTTEANVFSTGNSQNSRVTLGGVIASAPGAVTPLRLTGASSSGFNLTGANTFTGAVRLFEGTLGINSNASLGNPANALILDTNSSSSGGLEFLNGGIDIARPVTIALATRVLSNGVDVNTISGPVTGGGTLFKTGTGTLVLNNAGNDGSRDVRGGTLRVAAGALGTTGDLALSDGTTLAVTGDNSLAAARTVVLGSILGPATATVDVAANQTFAVDGLVRNNGGSSGILVKSGVGTLVLTGPANTYTGGTVVRAGAVQAAADGSLGAAAAPVAVEVGGRLTYTNSTATARTFTVPGGTLEAATGATVTLAGATVHGGFLRGAGAFALTGGTALSGVTTLTSTTISQTGPASVANFTNGGSFTVGAGRTLAWNGGTNTSSGRIFVNGTANVSEFVSDGQVNIPTGGVLNNSGSPLVLGGGSRTLIGSAAAPGGVMNLDAQTLELNGALLVNNGTVSGTTNVNFGSVVKGAGAFGVVNVNQGGVYAPGNSPGVSNATAVEFENTSTSFGGPMFEIELAGLAPGTGYDQLHVAGQLSLGGTLAVSLIDGFTPVVGNSFDILDWGSVSGTFSSISLPTLGSLLSWNTSQLYTIGVLSVVEGIAYSADFDDDGDVDGDDLSKWQGDFSENGLSDADNDGDSDGGDFLAWQRQLGSGLPALAAVQSIPEPCALALISMAGCGLARVRQRQH